MKRNYGHKRHTASSAGFTLIELLISLLILTIVSGIIFQRISTIVQRSQAEAEDNGPQ